MFIRRLGGHVRQHAVAYVALFFALSGTALAGTSYITKSEKITKGDLTGSTYGDPVIAAGKVTNKKLQQSSLTVNAGTGLSGGGSIALGGSGTLSLASGYQLPQSCSSGQVAKSDGSGGWSCGSANVSQMMGGSDGTISSLVDLAPVGLSTPNFTYTNVTAGASAVASTAGNLSVQVSTAPGSGNTWKFSLVFHGAVSSLSCTISGTATSCTDTSDTASIPAGTTASFQADPTVGTPAATRVTFGWTDTT